MPPATSTRSASPPFFVQRGRHRTSTTRPISAAVTRYCGAERKSIAFLTRVTGFMLLHRPRDPAVLADAPEVHGHQERRDQRNPDAVENVEAQQRARADETAAEEAESRVVGGRDELDVADLQERRARPLDTDERR